MKRPVLILGAVPRMTTPIARSLHRHGIEVDVATFSSVEGQLWSRAIRNFWRVPDPDMGASAFVSALSQIIREHGHDLLIPANDVALTAVMEHYECLQQLLHVGCPPPFIVNQVLNKNLTLEIARQLGIRIPRSAVVCRSDELGVAARELGFPIVLKPSAKKRTDEFKACVLRDTQSIEELLGGRREFSGPMLAQQFCEGEGVGVELLMHQGEALAVFQHRRLKEFPHGGGVAAVAMSGLPQPELVGSAVGLLRALTWEGPAMVEYKVNPADGVATLMEVNGRYWGTVSLPILAGIDFPLYHWQLLHGEVPQIPSSYEPGIKWRWTAGWLDRYHDLFLESMRRASARDLLIRELKNLDSDFDSSSHDAVFLPADPMPAIVEVWRAIKMLALSDVRRLLAVLRPSRHPAGAPAPLMTPPKKS